MDIPESQGLPIVWDDAAFDGFDADYDRVLIRLTDYTGTQIAVLCKGWISLSVAYFRDDSYVQSGRLIATDARIDAARDAVVSRGAPSGSPLRDAALFSLLEIELDDGARLECVAASFQVSLADTD